MIEWPPNIGIEPYYQDKYRVIYKGDCRATLSAFPAGLVSAVVTDPPYLLKFMGKSWDSGDVSFQPATWAIVRSVCKPGAMVLSFGGTRTFHRIACAIEDAGWEIRDTVMWVYGQGFPKSLNIGKAIDKAAGAERCVIGRKPEHVISDKWREREGRPDRLGSDFLNITVPATPEAKLWDGYGTALKPAWEPIIVAMNELDGTFANNALKHGVAGLNIDGCRIGYAGEADMDQARVPQPSFNSPTGAIYNFKTGEGRSGDMFDPTKGRFPANLIHDGSDEALELFPNVAGPWGKDGDGKLGGRTSMFGIGGVNSQNELRGRESGSAARFFYCAKASRNERNSDTGSNTYNRKCLKCGKWQRKQSFSDDYTCHCDKPEWEVPVGNNHPTVKPLALMRYLVKLVSSPVDAVILDPFCGSGTTLLACADLGIRSIGIDSDEKSCEIAANRCAADSVARLARGEY